MTSPPTFTRVVLAFNVLLFAGFGVAFIIAPQELLGVLDIELGSPAAFAEIRAMYGGVELGIAIYLAAALARRVDQINALTLATLCLGGLATIRLGSMLFTGYHSTLAILAAAEAAGVLLNLAAITAARGGSGH